MSCLIAREEENLSLSLSTMVKMLLYVVLLSHMVPGPWFPAMDNAWIGSGIKESLHFRQPCIHLISIPNMVP